METLLLPTHVPVADKIFCTPHLVVNCGLLEIHLEPGDKLFHWNFGVSGHTVCKGLCNHSSL